jgi:hypothetical protein
VPSSRCTSRATPSRTEARSSERLHVTSSSSRHITSPRRGDLVVRSFVERRAQGGKAGSHRVWGASNTRSSRGRRLGSGLCASLGWQGAARRPRDDKRTERASLRPGSTTGDGQPFHAFGDIQGASTPLAGGRNELRADQGRMPIMTPNRSGSPLLSVRRRCGRSSAHRSWAEGCSARSWPSTAAKQRGSRFMAINLCSKEVRL